MANQYFTCELESWVSGTAIYARMHYYRSGTYHYLDTSFPNPTMTIAGQSFTDSGFGDWVRGGIDVGDVRTTTFSKTVSANGTYGISFSAGSGLRSDFAGTWSGSATVTEAYTSPSTPSVSIQSKTHNSVVFKVSISSYGNPSSVSGRWIEAGVAGQNSWTSPSLRSAIATNTTSATITVNNSSTQTKTLTIEGNHRYWYGGYATNTKKDASTIVGTFYTPCPPLSVLALSSQAYSAYNKVNAVFSYTRQSDGGAETRTGQYRYTTDGGKSWTSWTSFGTVSNTTGTFTVSLPTSISSVILQARLSTPNGGASTVQTVNFSTKSTHTAPNFSNFAYEDASATAVAVSGNNSIFIQGQSQPKVTISAANKATANDGASITSYTASLNAQSIQIAYSASAAVSGTFPTGTPTASGTLALAVAANDSLALSKSVSKNVTVIPWAAPVLNATATRTNSFENETTLSISGTYSPITVSNVVKNTLAVAYRYKRSSSSTWGDWTARPITISGSSYSAVDLVLSFDNEYQWDIQVRAVDKFTTTTRQITLSVGKPTLFVGHKKAAINRKPTNSSADLDVEGFIYSKDQPVMTSHVGMVIMSTTLTTAAAVKAVYGGNWTAYSGFSVSGLYCWRRTS